MLGAEDRRVNDVEDNLPNDGINTEQKVSREPVIDCDGSFNVNGHRLEIRKEICVGRAQVGVVAEKHLEEVVLGLHRTKGIRIGLGDDDVIFGEFGNFLV